MIGRSLARWGARQERWLRTIPRTVSSKASLPQLRPAWGRICEYRDRISNVALSAFAEFRLLSRQLLLPFAMTLLALTHSACDALLGLYGTTPLPHRGRDRLVTFLSKRARNRWNSVRLMRRRGLVMESDLSVDDVGWTLYAYGCLDYWDERVIRGMLTPGCFCLDIGAHIGYYSLLFSRLAGHSGRVFGYEPVPYTYSFLERNLQRNGASNVRAQQAAAGSRNGVVRMAFPNGGRLGWCTVSDSGDVQVRCTMIDSEISRLALDRVDFVKIDTE